MDESQRTDAAVAALPPVAPGAPGPTLTLRMVSILTLALKIFFHANTASCLLLLFPALRAALAPSVLRLLLWLAALELVLYVITVTLASSRTALGWIVFGHPAKVLGAANNAGPFDRGATVVGLRSYSRPEDVGLPHARQVHIEVPGTSVILGAWHVLPTHHARSVLGRSAPAADEPNAQRHDAFDACLSMDGDASHGSAPASTSSSPVAVIYFHGNFESRAKWVAVEHARSLSSLFGLHVLALDYRGFGDSTGGPPTPEGLVDDAEAAVTWLGQRGVPPSRIVIYGHSLGTGVSSAVARRLDDLGTPPFAVVLEAPFYSMRAAALTFPLALVLLALPGAQALVLRTFLPSGFRVADALSALPDLPVLLLHGDNDTTVPIHHSVAIVQEVTKTCRNAPFRLVTFPGCDHLQCTFDASFIPSLDAFLRESQTFQKQRPHGARDKRQEPKVRSRASPGRAGGRKKTN